MMAAGEYSIIKARFEGKEVSYYVEKEYAPAARKIFGFTPERSTEADHSKGFSLLKSGL